MHALYDGVVQVRLARVRDATAALREDRFRIDMNIPCVRFRSFAVSFLIMRSRNLEFAKFCLESPDFSK